MGNKHSSKEESVQLTADDRQKMKNESVQFTADDFQTMVRRMEVIDDELVLSLQIKIETILQLMPEVIKKRKNIELRADEVFKIAEKLKSLIEASKLSKNTELGTEEAANTENQLEAKSREKLEKNNTVSITVLDPLPSGATKTFVKVLTVHLKKYGILLVKGNIEMFSDGSSTTDPVLVICNNHSRIGSDIHNTVSEVKNACFHRIVLLVLHCSKEQNLPTLLAKDELQKSGEFPGFQDVLDIAFDKTLGMDGIYDCNMNTNTIKTLEKLIKS